VQIFDSADDRLEFRMKKDIRFEDDTGAEILTIQKATRTLSGFKMTGDLEIEKSIPAIVLDDTAPAGSKAPFILFADAARWQYRDSDDTLRLEDVAVGVARFAINRSTGDITKVGHINMGSKDVYNWDGLRSRGDVPSPYITFRSSVYSFYHIRPSTGNVLEISHGATPGAAVIWTINTGGHVTQYGNLVLNDNSLRNAGLLEVKEIATPTTPATGYGRIYFKTDGRLYYLNDAGVEYGPL